MSQRKPSGHPAKQDPDIAKLYRTLKATTELVRDLEHRLTEEQWRYLRASATGLMFNYAVLTGLPTPIDIMFGDSDD